MATYTSVGSTTHFAISYDSSMGNAGAIVANGLLATSEADWKRVSDAFGGLVPSGGQIQVKVEKTTGGGSNDNLRNVDIRTGTDLQQARYVLVSEIAEIFMVAQRGGWAPGNSKGEALSRLLGADAYPAVPGPDGYLTASSWLNSSDRKDWVTANEATDTDFASTGCAILFLNYLRTQLEMPLTGIIADRSATLQGIYKNLTGSSDAFAPFARLLQEHFPAGRPVNLPNENPFPFSQLAPGSAIAMANQVTTHQVDALVVGRNGVVNVAWVDNGDRWHVPIPLTRTGFAPAGAPISLAHQASMSQLDALLVGNDGAVSVMWVAGTGVWQGPVPLTRAGFVPPGGHVALANQISMNQLDALFVANDGSVQVMWVVGGGAWHAPVPITGPGFAAPGACIALAHQGSMNQLDAVVVGNDGAVHVMWVTGAEAWHAPLPITGRSFAPPGANIALANQISMNQVDAVVVGNDGAVHVLWVVGGGAWQGPAGLTAAGFARPGAAVALANQTNMNQLDALLVAANGALNVLWVQGAGRWQGPVGLTAPGFAPSGAGLALAYQNSMNQLDAVLVGNDGRLSVLWVQGEGRWAGPAPIAQPIAA